MTDQLPGNRPYVLRDGEGLQHLVAGQIVRTVARVDETAGGFGAVVCDCPLDRGPIPMHWHEKEHDTWFVTRGQLQVWCGDQSRVLRAGDFGYVRPGDTHSYRSVAPRTRFFGIVAPGGWEQFFADAGEVYGMTALPPADRPFDFSRMGPAMAKHRIMRVENPVFVEATPMGEGDRAVPEGHESYFLEDSHGERRTAFGFLSTALITDAQSKATVDMRVIEGGRGAALPMMTHGATHVFLYMLDGSATVTLGGEEHRVVAGDAVNIPADTRYAIRVDSGTARWVAASAGGNGAGFWAAGAEAGYSPPLSSDPEVDRAAVAALTGVDVTLG